jgi:hypothetical protein
MVRWQSGDVADCKSAYVGSIPARTSRFFRRFLEIARFVLIFRDTEGTL